MLSSAGSTAIDEWPYPALGGLIALTALAITVLILISQRRENQLTELREQLTLELALLSEQKSAKIIELLEELRRDLPSVRDRPDEAAERLAQPADPKTVVDALRETQTGEPGGKAAETAAS